MTIEIDDSGTGDVIGPAYIGLMRVETGQLVIKEIPFEKFNDQYYKLQAPQIHAIELVQEGLKELKYEKPEKIVICRGPFLKFVKDTFHEKKIPYEEGVIEGPLQDNLENKMLLHFKGIGVDQSILDEIALYEDDEKKEYYHHRNRKLKDWVIKDYKNRLKFVKQGSKAVKTIKEELERKKAKELNMKITKEVHNLVDNRLYKEALEELEKTKNNVMYDWFEYIYYKSSILFLKEDFKSALELLEKIHNQIGIPLKYDWNFFISPGKKAQILHIWSSTLMKLNDLPRALEKIEEAINIEPDNSEYIELKKDILNRKSK